MALIAPTAATPPAPALEPLPPPLPDPSTPPAPGTDNRSVRNKIANWMEDHLGRAALPVAALAGGAAGAGLGLVTLGPVGGIVGGLAGAFYGAVLFMSD